MGGHDTFKKWADSLPVSWWDDAADAGGFLDSLEAAFTAGQQSKRRRDKPKGPLEARSTGSASHNSATRVGDLVLTIWGERKSRQVALILDEDAIAVLKQNLIRYGLL